MYRTTLLVLAMAGCVRADFAICVYQCYPTSVPEFVFGGLIDGVFSHEQAHQQCLHITFPSGVDCPYTTAVAYDRFWGGSDTSIGMGYVNGSTHAYADSGDRGFQWYQVIQNKHTANGWFGDVINGIGAVWGAVSCAGGDIEGCCSAVADVIKLAIAPSSTAAVAPAVSEGAKFAYWRVSR